MTANELVKNNTVHSNRIKNENLKKTKQVLEPQLQDEVNVMGNTITGCVKKRINDGEQTFKIGKNYE